jgi:Mn2+/Fe2+ NRAMP family transporter
MLIRICNNKKIMGEYTSGKLSNVFSIATFALMAFAAIVMLYTFVVK